MIRLKRFQSITRIANGRAVPGFTHGRSPIINQADKTKLNFFSTVSKKKKKKKGGKSSGDVTDKELKQMIAAVDAPTEYPPRASKVEMDRRYNIGRTYTIEMFRRNNELDHDISCKIKMKLHAIKMLPKNSVLRDDALKIVVGKDDPPEWRRIPLETPPIPGYNPQDHVFEEEE